jgi:hypothetical protein
MKAAHLMIFCVCNAVHLSILKSRVIKHRTSMEKFNRLLLFRDSNQQRSFAGDFFSVKWEKTKQQKRDQREFINQCIKTTDRTGREEREKNPKANNAKIFI